MDAPPAASSQGMGASATPVPSPTFGEGKLEMEKEKKKREKARARCPLPERIIRTRICYPCCGDVGFTPTRQGEGWGGQRELLLKKTNKQTPKNPLQRSGPKGKMHSGCLCSPSCLSPRLVPSHAWKVSAFHHCYPKMFSPGPPAHHHDHSPRRGKKSQSPQISRSLSSLPVLHPKTPVPQ